MIEEDIQYLGMKIASSAHAGYPFTPVTGKARMPGRSIFGRPNERTPSGVVLHVEANGGQPPFDLRFLRSLTSAVTIGRKSTSDHKPAPGEPSIAGFACQVVSGKHAKLAFSDSGFVYIIDLGSRHGTHIRRPGETVSKTLEPEIVTMLNSGDYITFGKTVGKGSQLVPPITARIQFLYGHGPEAPEIYEVPSKTPTPFAGASPEPEPSRARKTSGRYGLYAPSSLSLSSPEHSSDEDSFSSSNSKYDSHDSDIEEIPADQVVHTTPSVYSPASAIRALQVHMRAQVAPAPYEHPQPLPLRTENPASAFVHVPSRSHSPMDLSSPTPSRSPVLSAYPLELDLELEPDYQTCLEHNHGLEPIVNSPSEASSCSEGEGEKEASEPEHEPEHEEGEVLNDEHSPEAADPLFSSVVTPSPLSRAASANRDLDEDMVMNRRPSPCFMDSAPAPLLDSESRSPSPPSEFDFQGQVKAKELVSESVEQVDDMAAKINDSIERIGRELREASVTHEQWNADNVASLNAALNDLPGPIAEWAESILDKASAGQKETIITPSTSVRDETAETLAEVKAHVAAITVLVSELKAFHDNMEKQMSERLASIEFARAELAAAAANSEVQVGPNHLKRKHDELETLENHDCLVMDLDLPVSVEARPKKKLRRFASSVMHTATAVTVGAVATWAALAFS